MMHGQQNIKLYLVYYVSMPRLALFTVSNRILETLTNIIGLIK